MANMENDPKAKEVLDQEVSVDDLNAVSGGESANNGNCVQEYYRDIRPGGRGFPNCAATVEDGSHCGTNDACYNNAVVYTHMDKCSISDCKKAWK